MDPIAPRLPRLPTLVLPASWHNRSGRVDRSACLELRASEVRPFARLKLLRTASSLEAAGSFLVTARFLYQLHRKRLPRQLAGDLRTTKSNAMKPLSTPRFPPPCQEGDRAVGDAPGNPVSGGAGDGPACSTRESIELSPPVRRHERIHSPAPAPNPNRGATRTRMLGLHAAGDAPGIEEDWHQTVGVERRRIHPHLARHFLICPVCGARCGKLFMVLCTEAECLDAELAEGWIRMLDGRYSAARKPIPADLLAARDKLITRYGLIFRRRRLLCRKCLNLRYGEAPKNRPTIASTLADIPTERQRYALNLMQYIIDTNSAIRALQSELRLLEPTAVNGKTPRSPHTLPRKTIPLAHRPRHSIFKPLPRPPKPPRGRDHNP